MKSDYLKWAVVGVVGFYLYTRWQEGSEDGKIAGHNIDPSKVVDSAMPWLNVNPVLKPFVGGLAKKFLQNVSGFDKTDAIEASYKRM